MVKLFCVALLACLAMATIDIKFEKVDQWGCSMSVVMDSHEYPASTNSWGGIACMIQSGETIDTTSFGFYITAQSPEGRSFMSEDRHP